MTDRFLPLLLVVLLAFFVPILLARYRRVPVVVGEILAGILVGPSFLGFVQGDEPTLELLAEIGFAFLMFMSGLEIDFSFLFASMPGKQKNGIGPFWISIYSFLLALLLAGLLGFGLARSGYVRDPWIMTLILSTTSLGIVVPVLKERQITSTKLGQTILLSAILADFLTMFFVTVYVAIRSTGLTLNILLIATLFIPVFLLYRLGVRQLRRPRVQRLIEDLADATAQIKVRGAFAIMIAFVVLAELLGAELILGAFLGGVLASLLSGADDEKLRYKLDAIGFGLFIPIFFIYVGIGFDLSAFLENPSAWLLLPILLAASFVIKILSTTIFRLSFGWKESLASGMLLSARLSLIIAASSIGLRLGAISESTNAAIILVAVLTATVSPLAFNSLLPSLEDRRRRVILIYGASDLASQVLRDMKAHGEEVYYFDGTMVPLKVRAKKKEAERPAPSYADLEQFLNGWSLARVQAFLALDKDDENNLLACKSARTHGIDHILSFVGNPAHLPDFRGLGVQTLTPSLFRASLMALMARNPTIFSLLTSTEDDRDLRELRLSNPDLDGARLSRLKLPADFLVLTISRGDETIVPHGNTRLARGDRLTILGDSEKMESVQMWLE